MLIVIRISAVVYKTNYRRLPLCLISSKQVCVSSLHGLYRLLCCGGVDVAQTYYLFIRLKLQNLRVLCALTSARSITLMKLNRLVELWMFVVYRHQNEMTSRTSSSKARTEIYNPCTPVLLNGNKIPFFQNVFNGWTFY